MASMVDVAPPALPDESARAYEYFRRWYCECAANAPSDVVAATLGVTPSYVRRLWTRWDWKARRSNVEVTVTEQAMEQAVAKAASSLADRAAEALEQASYARSFLAAQYVNKALTAVRDIDPESLDPMERVRFGAEALRLLNVGNRATSVQVSSDGAVHVDIAEISHMPEPMAAKRALEVAAETSRQAELLNTYHRDSDTN